MKKILLFVIASFFTSVVSAGPHFLSGNLSNIASSSSTISIKLHNGVPDNCQGVAYGWMTIKKEDTPMVSMILSMWVSGKHKATVYTRMEGTTCYIYSVDPTFNQ
ncbi:hypothetical protein EYS14_03690 [Alteromonadaceae bacterium M269]|nr:hypothetical protein EYS14_03690 [Alteromonadaceae bacterium M269]